MERMKDFHKQGTSLEDPHEERKSWEDLVEWETVQEDSGKLEGSVQPLGKFGASTENTTPCGLPDKSCTDPERSEAIIQIG